MKRAADDMSEAEVARARAQMKAGLLMGLESPSARAERWRAWCDLGPGAAARGDRRRIDAVTRARARLCRDAVPRAPAALALYGPVRARPSLAAIREAGRLMLSRAAKSGSRPTADAAPAAHADFRAWTALRREAADS
jgi:hypothetical protein